MKQMKTEYDRVKGTGLFLYFNDGWEHYYEEISKTYYKLNNDGIIIKVR